MNNSTLYSLVMLPIVIAPIYMFYINNDNKESADKKTNMETKQEYFMQDNHEQIEVNEFKKELENPEITLIDVRTPEELVKHGKIRDEQKLIVFGTETFTEEILKLDKSRKYLIYCWHGNRSATAREFMKENGFLWVKDLRGGIDVWK